MTHEGYSFNVLHIDNIRDDNFDQAQRSVLFLLDQDWVESLVDMHNNVAQISDENNQYSVHPFEHQ